MHFVAWVFGSTFGGTFAIVLIGGVTTRPSRNISNRLESIKKSASELNVSAEDFEKLATSARLHSIEMALEQMALGRRLKPLLRESGCEGSLHQLCLMQAGTTLATAVIVYAMLGNILLAVVGGLPAVFLPVIYLRIRRSRRLKAFNAALPDAIDLMARSLVAGHSIGSAIEMIGEQAPQPLAYEFIQVFQRQKLGLNFREALLQMGARVPSRDLQFLITAILVQKETGGELTEILARTAHVIRERIRIQGEVRTRTAQGRLTGWILGALPVVMLGLINLISPGYSSILFHDPVGQTLLGSGVVLIAVGAFVIRRVVDIKV